MYLTPHILFVVIVKNFCCVIVAWGGIMKEVLWFLSWVFLCLHIFLYPTTPCSQNHLCTLKIKRFLMKVRFVAKIKTTFSLILILRILNCLLVICGRNQNNSKFITSHVFLIKIHLKFISSEKATKLCEIFTLLLSYVVPVKIKVKISQNFVALSEYMNFRREYHEHYCNFAFNFRLFLLKKTCRKSIQV